MAFTRVLATGEVSRDLLEAIRALCDDAFHGEFSDDDWDHSLGGVHALVSQGDLLVAHASVVPRVLEIGERSLDAGYVEAVATAPSMHGRGIGSQAMTKIGEVIRAQYEIGGLSTDRHSFYERLGWERWRGPSYVRRGSDTTRTPDEDDGIMVLRFGPSAGVDLTDSIVCEARSGDDW
jgi:aminoglycoside 2'-N-acetyltransferase I